MFLQKVGLASLSKDNTYKRLMHALLSPLCEAG